MNSDAGAGVVIILLVAAAYFLPALVALSRKTSNTAAAVVVNVFLGWTLIGWVIALALAASGTVRPRPGFRNAPVPGQLSPDGYWMWDGARWLPAPRPPEGPPK